jgi:hypothetical protein
VTAEIPQHYCSNGDNKTVARLNWGVLYSQWYKRENLEGVEDRHLEAEEAHYVPNSPQLEVIPRQLPVLRMRG